jgi:hypothetical protein
VSSFFLGLNGVVEEPSPLKMVDKGERNFVALDGASRK